MIKPDLLQYEGMLRTKRADGKTLLFDRIRKKWLVLQPEELVRQLLVTWLVEAHQYNPRRMSLERGLLFNGLARRYDLLVYDPEMRPFLLAECKAPAVDLDAGAARQIALYNMVLQVPYLLLTNGRYLCLYAIDHQEKSFEKLGQVPPYPGRPPENSQKDKAFFY